MLIFRNLRNFKSCLLGVVCAICLLSGSAKADVCFLPSGGCVALDSLYSQVIGGNDQDCAGYETEKKGQGWNCSTCTAHGHTYYNCTPKNCGSGFQPGVNSCPRGYTHEYEKKTDEEGNETIVYSGDLKCGKCKAPDECPTGTQKSSKCEEDGYKSRETQYYVGPNVCYVCLDDNCYDGKEKYCSWSSGSQDGPEGSDRAISVEWYNSTARTQYGSICYECCDNVCTQGSQEVTSCDPSTELLRTLEYTDCHSACNECCNNVCSSGSLNVTECSSGYYLTTDATTECGNDCNSCHDCGGYTEEPSGCYSCTSRECGGETRYDCTELSDECSSGEKDPSCESYETKTQVSTTDCGNACYSCSCTPTNDEVSDDNTCKTEAYDCDDGCGGTRTCYKSACGDNQTCQNGTCVDDSDPDECNYQYRVATISDACGKTNLDTDCAYSTCCHNGLDALSSMYVSGGSPKVTVYNRIKKSTNTCKDSSNVTKYEEICSGTPKALCTSSTYKFVSNGCESKTEYNGGFYMYGDEWGDCVKDCSSMGDGYYDTQDECKPHNNNLTCPSDSGCYVTCQAKGYYSTQSACENANSGKVCILSSNCYKTCEDISKYSTQSGCGTGCTQDTDGCYIKTKGKVTTTGKKDYCCTNTTYSGCLTWGVFLQNSSGSSIYESEVSPGDYKICVDKETASPPTGSHAIMISTVSFKGQSFNTNDMTQGPNYVCTKTSYHLNAGDSWTIGATVGEHICTGDGAHTW